MAQAQSEEERKKAEAAEAEAKRLEEAGRWLTNSQEWMGGRSQQLKWFHKCVARGGKTRTPVSSK